MVESLGYNIMTSSKRCYSKGTRFSLWTFCWSKISRLIKFLWNFANFGKQQPIDFMFFVTCRRFYHDRDSNFWNDANASNVINVKVSSIHLIQSSGWQVFTMIGKNCSVKSYKNNPQVAMTDATAVLFKLRTCQVTLQTTSNFLLKKSCCGFGYGLKSELNICLY